MRDRFRGINRYRYVRKARWFKIIYNYIPCALAAVFLFDVCVFDTSTRVRARRRSVLVIIGRNRIFSHLDVKSVLVLSNRKDREAHLFNKTKTIGFGFVGP